MPAAAAMPRRHRPWGFWATTAWGLVIIVGWYAVQLGLVFAVLSWLDTERSADIAAIQRQMLRGDSIAIAAFGTLPLSFLLIALAIRFSGLTTSDYLALRWPRAIDFAVGFAVLIIGLGMADLVTHLSGRAVVAPAVLETYRVAQQTHTLAWLGAALVIAAPLGEEVIFRGFLFRGWAASRIGPLGAIAFTAAIWAAMHVQYDWFFMSQIFGLGLLFGWLRWRCDSIVLTMLLHAAVNAAALAQALFLYR